jgi:hypothetical protein
VAITYWYGIYNRIFNYYCNVEITYNFDKSFLHLLDTETKTILEIMDFSVIIPTKNRVKYINDLFITLNDAIKSYIGNVEVIIVDTPTSNSSIIINI